MKATRDIRENIIHEPAVDILEPLNRHEHVKIEGSRDREGKGMYSPAFIQPQCDILRGKMCLAHDVAG